MAARQPPCHGATPVSVTTSPSPACLHLWLPALLAVSVTRLPTSGHLGNVQLSLWQLAYLVDPPRPSCFSHPFPLSLAHSFVHSFIHLANHREFS